MNKTAVKSVGQVQRELLQWLEAHLPELHRVGPHSTLWYGVMQKCGASIENLLRAAAHRFLLALGPRGEPVMRSVGNGKPLEKFTLGQCAKLLQELEGPIVEWMTEGSRLPVPQDPLIDKRGLQLLDRVSRLRNDFAHSHWPTDGSSDLTIEFLEKSAELCQTRIIALAVALESAD